VQQNEESQTKKTFSVPLDKIPEFNLKNSNYSNKFYKSERVIDKENNLIAYEDVKHFIVAFERTMAFYGNDIDIHWQRAIETSFTMSVDEMPRV
jgi:threonyl-tRNA synthetase